MAKESNGSCWMLVFSVLPSSAPLRTLWSGIALDLTAQRSTHTFHFTNIPFLPIRRLAYKRECAACASGFSSLTIFGISSAV